MATVWDREIAGVLLALDLVTVCPVLVLSDSQAAIASVWNAAVCGSARSVDLRAVVNMVREWTSAVVPIRFSCVKAHVGIVGNELANEMVRLGCTRGDPPVVTEGGVRALWKGTGTVGRGVWYGAGG